MEGSTIKDSKGPMVATVEAEVALKAIAAGSKAVAQALEEAAAVCVVATHTLALVVAMATLTTTTIVAETAGATKKMLETGVQETLHPSIKDLKLLVPLTQQIEVACAAEAPVVDVEAWTNPTVVATRTINPAMIR